MIESIQVAKFSASSILVYSKVLDREKRSDRQKENEVNLRDQEYNGFMSPKTKIKVRKMLDGWLTAVDMERKRLRQGRYWMNGRLTFVTLTLSAKQFHDDNYIKRNMLNRFIIEAKRDWDIYNYFWRAEPQKNGNIHFHIIIDKYVHWREVRNKWNAIQDQHGYLENYKNEFMHSDANSTDIHGLEKVGNVSAYLIKYCCKTTGFRKISGRIWGSSDSIRCLTAYETELSNDVKKYIERVEIEKDVKVIHKEDFTLIFCNNNEKLSKFAPNIFRSFKAHYSEMYNDLYTMEGRKKCSEKIRIEKELQAYRAPNDRVPLSNRSRVLGSPQLSLFVPSNLAMLR